MLACVKKALVLLLLPFLLASPVFSNDMHLFDADSFEYRAAVRLCSYAGVPAPSSALPVTASEIRLALMRINPEALGPDALALFEKVLVALSGNEDAFVFDFDLALSPFVYVTPDQWGAEGIVADRNDFFLPYRDERPFIELDFKFDFGRNVFMEAELPLINGPIGKGMNLTSFDFIINYRDGKWNFFGNKSTSPLGEMPTLARGAIGNRWVNLIAGRSPHSIGSGITGNLVVGDNFLYQDLVKLSFVSEPFTYNISYTHFDEQISETGFQKFRVGGMHQVRVVHRFDVTLFNRLRLALDMGTLYYSTSAFDFRFFNPLMLSHNYYNYDESSTINKAYDEANNTMGLAFEYNIAPEFLLTAQVVVDQFQLPNEKDDLPPALGGLVNFSWSDIQGPHSIRVWTEFVYTTPYLYLNRKSSADNPAARYNYDWILGYYSNREWQASHAGYSGYVYGPDCILFALGADYDDFESLSASLRLQYRAHGEKGLSDWEVDDDFSRSTPSGIVEHRFSVSGDVEWGFAKNLELLSGVDLSYNLNYKNNKDRDVFVPQMYFGVTWRPL